MPPQSAPSAPLQVSDAQPCSHPLAEQDPSHSLLLASLTASAAACPISHQPSLPGCIQSLHA